MQNENHSFIIKKYILIAAAAVALSACDKNVDNPDNPDSASGIAVITATILDGLDTRASDSDWAKGDTIGITSTVGSVTGPYINIKYTTSEGDGKFTGPKLYFYNRMTLTAYYPYKGVQDEAPGENGIIEANTGADYQTLDKHPEIDFLWDSKTGVNKQDFSASNPEVNFVFSHRMSKVTFTFQSSDDVWLNGMKFCDGVDVENLVRYKLNDLGIDGTFNTVTGECAIKNDAPRNGLSIEVGKGNAKDNEAVLPIIIFPQTLEEGRCIMDVYTDELNSEELLQHYKCTLTFSNGEIKPGYHYNYTIKVTKIGLIVGEMTVEPWKVENKYMTATIDGDKVFQEQNNISTAP